MLVTRCHMAQDLAQREYHFGSTFASSSNIATQCTFLLPIRTPAFHGYSRLATGPNSVPFRCTGLAAPYDHVYQPTHMASYSRGGKREGKKKKTSPHAILVLAYTLGNWEPMVLCSANCYLRSIRCEPLKPPVSSRRVDRSETSELM